ncbi:hypothetical protein F5146DRAFT_996812 [Armillaria mellea]|nr:hypothetical protein F5146DRAFT_996812 [Armillaria mellea]
MASTETPTVPFFRKKGKARPTTGRKRSTSPSVTHTEASAGTKRRISDRDDDLDAPEREGPDVKWSSSGSHVNAALDIIAGDELEELGGEEADKRKGGWLGATTRCQMTDSIGGKNKEVPKAMRVGPQRSTNTIRTVTIVDYQPDVCKDYKETGYCGFGDTCKFLHDRGTYLAGWQLDQLADNPKKQVEDDSSGSDSDDEDVPFACLICRKHYTDPIVTRCGHYFCSACAIKRFAKTPKCAACGAPTGGMFNRADKVIAKMNKKRQEKGDQSDGENDEGEAVEIEGLGDESGNKKGHDGSNSDSDEDSDEA